MARFLWDSNKYGDVESTVSARAFHTAIRQLVKQRLADSGDDWNSFVFNRSYDLITAADFEKVEADLLATGHRFQFSAVISAKEAPEKYQQLTGKEEAPPALADASGRVLVGHGDNVALFKQNAVGIARYVRTTEEVMGMMVDGVPPDTIAIIDDSGGTLTAPILEGFKAIVCMGGSTRSHLGILSREYGIPCLMNSKVSGIRNGDRLELNVTAPTRTAQDYQKGIEKTAEIWKLA